MTLLHKLALMALVAIAALTVTPRQADACSPPACYAGSFLPSHGTVPANLPAIVWIPLDSWQDVPDPAKVELHRIDQPVEMPIPFSATELVSGAYLLIPEVSLVPGATYRIVDQSDCWADSEGFEFPKAQAIFEAGPEAPLPAVLGAVAFSAQQVGSIEVEVGECGRPGSVDAAHTRASVEPDRSAAPWLDALSYEIEVDGRPWYGSRFEARELLYRSCSDDPDEARGLSAGAHEVRIRGVLRAPGLGDTGELVVETPSVELTLECPGGDGDDSDEVCAGPDCDDDPGGCAVGGPGGPLTAGFVLLLAALRRSRRRR